MTDWKSELRTRMESLHLNPSTETQIIEELAQHMDDRYRELCDSGIAEADAARHVLQEIGDDARFAAALKPVRATRSILTPVPAMSSKSRFAGLWQDFRHALRLLRKEPLLSAVAILMLAIGIGANAAVFSVARGVLLKPAPFKDGERIVTILAEMESGGRLVMRPQRLQTFQETSKDFERIAVGINPTLFSKDGEQSANVYFVSADFFRVLQVTPLLGRDFSDYDFSPDAAPVGLISQTYWQNHFAKDPNVIGRTIALPDDAPFPVIGIAPDVTSPSDGGAKSADMFVTTSTDAAAITFYGFYM